MDIWLGAIALLVATGMGFAIFSARKPRPERQVHDEVEPPAPRQEVVVKDIEMAFGSMVVFLVQLAVASIPAILILAFVGILIWGFFTAVVLAVGGGA